MTSMRAWSQSVFGKGASHIGLSQLAVPVAREQDIIVRVKAVATNPVDGKVRSPPADKKEGEAIGKTLVVGWDAAGVVESVGARARRFKVGDEVYFAGDITRQGCFAELVAVDENLVAHRPRSLDWRASASVPLVALTAYEALVEKAGVAEGQGRGKSLLVIAGAGGVGATAIQLAKRVLHFDTVVATASRPESVAFCREMGADAVIDHTADLKEQLKSVPALALAGGAVDVLLNCAEADGNFDQLADLVAPLGHIVLITGLHRNVNITPLMAKRLSLHFEFMFSRSMFNHQPYRQSEILERFSRWLDQGLLKHTSRQHKFTSIMQLPQALELQDSGRAVGKIALDADWK